MKLQELIERLRQFPSDAPVFVNGDTLCGQEDRFCEPEPHLIGVRVTTRKGEVTRYYEPTNKGGRIIEALKL